MSLFDVLVAAVNTHRRSHHRNATIRALDKLIGRHWSKTTLCDAGPEIYISQLVNWGWADGLNPEETAVMAVTHAYSVALHTTEASTEDDDLVLQNPPINFNSLFPSSRRDILRRIRTLRDDGYIRRGVAFRAEKVLGHAVHQTYGRSISRDTPAD